MLKQLLNWKMCNISGLLCLRYSNATVDELWFNSQHLFALC